MQSQFLLDRYRLGRIPSPPDSRDLQLEDFLSDDLSDLERALIILQASHAAKATKEWAAIVTKILYGTPTPAPTPAPQPSPDPPPPTSDVIWSDPDWVLDQGSKGVCVGDGWAQWGNSDPVNDHFTQQDAMDIYYEATCIDGQCDDPRTASGGQQGSTVRSGAKAMQKRGRLTAYAFASTTDAVKQWVTAHGPVVVGTDWTNDMFNPVKGYVQPTAGVAGGHCYLLIGYLAAEDAFLFLNSWGASWGLSGRFKMKVSDFATLLAQQGEACVALEVAA